MDAELERGLIRDRQSRGKASSTMLRMVPAPPTEEEWMREIFAGF